MQSNTVSSINSVLVSKNLNDQLLCKICSFQYVEPKLLSCLHSFCKSCINKELVKLTEDQIVKISCKICNTVTKVIKFCLIVNKKNMNYPAMLFSCYFI
jgi:hypothetical protein